MAIATQTKTTTSTLPSNPWGLLREGPEYVLAQDDVVLRKLPATRGKLQLQVLPAPFHGDPRTAPVVLLGFHPSYTVDSDHETPDEKEQLRLSLTFRSRTPFFHFDPAFSGTYGYQYWHQLLGALIDRVGLERVGQSVATVEWSPYRSASGDDISPLHQYLLPSQNYGFALVREAIHRGATIVVLHKVRWWLDAVPELASAPYVEVNNHRRPYVSPGNIGPGAFEALAHRLNAG